MTPKPAGPTRFDGTDGHLTEDQVDEVLMEFAEPDTLAHLTGCAVCQGRVRSFQDSMALFNQTTLTWAEAKSSTLPPPVAVGTRLRWSWAVASPVAASLLAGAALLAVHHRASMDHANSAPSVQVVVSDVASDPNPEQLARDNAMLEAIDTEMQPVESPLSPYGTAAPHSRARAPWEIRN